MFRRSGILMLFVVSVCLAGNDGTVFTSSTGFSGKKLRLTITRGKHFVQKKRMKLITLKIRPQMALWLEDTAGTFIKTLYVTRCFGKQVWHSIKEQPDSTYRTSCMPYWFNRMQKGGEKAPTSGSPFPDGISGATPNGDFSVDFNVPDSLDEVVLLLEWNSSFDNNETFSQKEVGFNGQPSCIAKVRIPLNTIGSDPLALKIVGHGGDNGDDAQLYPDTEKLTTALTILGKMEVVVIR